MPDASNINWDLFTREEKDNVMTIINMNSRENLATVIENMTPDKELELQKIADSLKPLVPDYESTAATEYALRRQKEGLPESPQSPEEEAELQKLIDAERAAHESKKAKAEPAIEVPLAVEPPVSPPAADTTAGETTTTGEKPPFCTQCDSKGVRHKKDCPTLKTTPKE